MDGVINMKDMKVNENFFMYLSYEGGERNAKQESCMEDVSQAIRVYFQSGIENYCLKELVMNEVRINEAYSTLMEDTLQKVQENYVDYDNLLSKIYQLMNDAVYLSGLKRILSEYYKERKRREERQQFKQAQKKYRELYKITDVVSKGNATIKIVIQAVPITQRRLNNVINANAALFHIKEKKQDVYLSLTPKGKRFHSVALLPDTIEMQECQKKIYNECSNLLKGLTYCIQSEKIEAKIPKMSDLTLQQRHALEQQYIIALRGINQYKNQSYSKFNVILNNNFDTYNKIFKTPYGDENEKCRIISKK